MSSGLSLIAQYDSDASDEEPGIVDPAELPDEILVDLDGDEPAAGRQALEELTGDRAVARVVLDDRFVLRLQVPGDGPGGGGAARKKAADVTVILESGVQEGSQRFELLREHHGVLICMQIRGL